MGSYSAQFSLFSIVGSPNHAVLTNGGNSYYIDRTAATSSATLSFNLSGNCISLDGNPAISFASLPSGFRFVTVALRRHGTAADPFGYLMRGADNDFASESIIYANGSPSPSVYTKSGPIGSDSGLWFSVPAPFFANYPTIVDVDSLLIVSISFIIGVNPLSNGLASVVDTIDSYGTYDIVNYSWTLKHSVVDVGSKVTVSTPSNAIPPLDPTQILTLNMVLDNGTVVNIPSINWTTVTPLLFEFTIPSLAGNPGTVEFYVTSTQFSGSVPLGKLTTIYFRNAPGIYRIVSGKTNDTLYDVVGGGTVDVKIPNPFVKTAFIP